MLLDPNEPAHRRAIERLEAELIIWMTTVGAEGRPASSPVWFVWNGEEFLIFSRPKTRKIRNIKANPLVALNLDGNGRGGDIVTFEATAELVDSPAYSEVPEAVAKYAERTKKMGYTKESFAADYSQTIRVRPSRVRAW